MKYNKLKISEFIEAYKFLTNKEKREFREMFLQYTGYTQQTFYRSLRQERQFPRIEVAFAFILLKSLKLKINYEIFKKIKQRDDQMIINFNKTN